MRAIILVGWTDGKDVFHKPQCLYCGLDGVAANAAEDKARESGKYIAIGRLNNPSFVKRAHVPYPKPAKVEVEAPKQEAKATTDSQPQTTKE